MQSISSRIWTRVAVSISTATITITPRTPPIYVSVICIYTNAYIKLCPDDQPAPISSPHRVTSLCLSSSRSLYRFGHFHVFFVWPFCSCSLMMNNNATKIKWAHITFYLLTTFPFIARSDLTANQWERLAFRIESFSLTYFRIVLIIWLKSSKESRGLRLTSSSTVAHQTGWLWYFSTQDLIRMIPYGSNLDLTGVLCNKETNNNKKIIILKQ